MRYLVQYLPLMIVFERLATMHTITHWKASLHFATFLLRSENWKLEMSITNHIVLKNLVKEQKNKSINKLPLGLFSVNDSHST